MRRYREDDEERIRTQGMVREWTRSKLLTEEQSAKLLADVTVDLRRTNNFLRAALALFTAIIVAAAVGLIAITLEVRSESAIAALTLFAAVACYGLAERFVVLLRLYRFGVEEMLAVAAVVLACISTSALMWAGKAGQSSQIVMPLAVGALGGFGLFLRFGFVYGAVGALVCASAMPFQVNAPASIQRLLAAAMCAAAFAFSRAKTREHRNDYLRDDYGLLQGAAWAGVYLLLNVKIIPGWVNAGGWFYWWSYAMTWVLPPIGLAIGVRDGEQSLIDVSALMLLATMVTSKPYLGWTRNSWDPIVFGVVLIGAAIALRRWLQDGPGGERDGFTSARLLAKDGELLSRLATAAALRSTPTAHPVETGPSQFEGGRSGGAGGGDRF
jgi:hypothetical protein